jgi:hypothetical protein
VSSDYEAVCRALTWLGTTDKTWTDDDVAHELLVGFGLDVPEVRALVEYRSKSEGRACRPSVDRETEQQAAGTSQMKLTSSSTGSFVKFREPGEVVKGRFVSFETGVDGKFGKEDVLKLETADGTTTVKCPAQLSKILSENFDVLEGKVLKIEYTGNRSISGGRTLKTFDVDAEECKEAASL